MKEMRMAMRNTADSTSWISLLAEGLRSRGVTRHVAGVRVFAPLRGEVTIEDMHGGKISPLRHGLWEIDRGEAGVLEMIVRRRWIDPEPVIEVNGERRSARPYGIVDWLLMGIWILPAEVALGHYPFVSITTMPLLVVLNARLRRILRPRLFWALTSAIQVPLLLSWAFAMAR